MSIPRIAITGGPAAGKTTVLHEIPKRYGGQVLTMPEVASILFDGGFPKPGKDTDYTDRWADSFQEPVIAVQRNMKNEYIEMPKIDLPSEVGIRQGYLDLKSEVRVRDMAGQYYLTIKSEGDIQRSESELAINREAFNQLWVETEGMRIFKTRYFIPYGDYTIELDFYHDKLQGLITFECEFKSVEEANAFTVPQWAEGAGDITNDVRFKNRKLAMNGLPKML